jgi:hypothetical protein
VVHGCPQVGKHLGDVQRALPLRLVSKEFRDVVLLKAQDAEQDMEPSGSREFNEGVRARKQRFFKACPSLTKLTYHVAPGVTAAKVGSRGQINALPFQKARIGHLRPPHHLTVP